jgi:hypothetical protein
MPPTCTVMLVVLAGRQPCDWLHATTTTAQVSVPYAGAKGSTGCPGPAVMFSVGEDPSWIRSGAPVPAGHVTLPGGASAPARRRREAVGHCRCRSQVRMQGARAPQAWALQSRHTQSPGERNCMRCRGRSQLNVVGGTMPLVFTVRAMACGEEQEQGGTQVAPPTATEATGRAHGVAQPRCAPCPCRVRPCHCWPP